MSFNCHVTCKGNTTESGSESSMIDSTESDSGSVASDLEITATFTYSSVTPPRITVTQALAALEAALVRAFPGLRGASIDFENALCYDDNDFNEKVKFCEELKPILSQDDLYWLRARGWTEAEIIGLEFMCQERRMGKTQKEMVAEIEEFENPGSTKEAGEMAEETIEETEEQIEENEGAEMTEEEMKAAKKLAKKTAKLKAKKANRIKRRS